MSDTLTALCQAMVKTAPNGLSAEQIAAVIGCPYPTMMSELSRQPGHKLGAERMLALMKATDCRAPMHHMARELGGVFVELQPAQAKGHELTRGLVESIREFGEFAGQTARALEDGSVSSTEAERIGKEGQEALTAILAVMEMAKNAQQGSRP